MGMTIDEAIRLNEEHAHLEEKNGYQHFAKALRLGTEALKAVKRGRSDFDPDEYSLLPGETED